MCVPSTCILFYKVKTLVWSNTSMNPLLTRTRSITDRVIKMMEKYTDQLEVLVEEKTAELTLEKQKADELLYKMLPR